MEKIEFRAVIKFLTKQGKPPQTILEEMSSFYGDSCPAKFTVSRQGKPALIYKGYTYRKHQVSKRGIRWACSSHKHCTACVHTHDTSETVVKEGAKFTVSKHGKPALIYKGYTYRKHQVTGRGIRWACSSHKHCTACVHTPHDNSEIVVKEGANEEITDLKPVFTTSKKGKPVLILGGYKYYHSDPLTEVKKPMFTYSQKGKKNIIMNGYKFYKKTDSRRPQSTSRARWVCSKGLHMGCTARMITQDDTIVACQPYHNHKP
ncbi:unnamed protein product [Diatraea saccharalis]|uniref:FLYWCH-type domain-containing protein n=1 Tax=Diatraea saccharalis TaxID=40085 RepID=A0A9N9R199_9NEOP|nr:unnamed protein product [Diatraea saccharalis]